MRPTLTERELCRNIRATLRKARAGDRVAGRRWYSEAHRFCRLLAGSTGYTVEQVVGVFAALSPQCPWRDNLLGTLQLCKVGSISADLNIYPLNLSKAQSILGGTLSPLAVLRGEKVRAFFANTLRPLHSKAVTVDTHTIRVATGYMEVPPKLQQWAFREKGSKAIQRAFRRVARRRHTLPSTIQATCWLAIRRALNEKPRDETLPLYIK